MVVLQVQLNNTQTRLIASCPSLAAVLAARVQEATELSYRHTICPATTLCICALS